MLVNYSKNYIVSFIGDLKNVVKAITEKAMDTSMQYDTEAAWKSVGEVLKNFAANMRWACVRMVGGVSIFQFSPISLNSNLIFYFKN